MDQLIIFLISILTISSKSLGRNPTEEEETTLNNMEYLIRTNRDIETLYDQWGDDYVHGIYYSKITPLDTSAPKYDPYKSKKRGASNISTHFKYLSTDIYIYIFTKQFQGCNQ